MIVFSFLSLCFAFICAWALFSSMNSSFYHTTQGSWRSNFINLLLVLSCTSFRGLKCPSVLFWNHQLVAIDFDYLGLTLSIPRCSWRYDGQRAQIHRLEDGSVRVFSRNGDETTSRFPDLIEIVKDSSAPTAVTFILDAEVIFSPYFFFSFLACSIVWLACRLDIWESFVSW